MLEVQDVPDISRPPAIDALILVADDAQVTTLLRQEFDDLILRDVGVLELVNQHILEALLIVLQDRRRLPEEAHRHQQQVVEVERAVAAQQLLVAPIDAGYRLLPAAFGLVAVLLGTDQLALGVGDRAQE